MKVCIIEAGNYIQGPDEIPEIREFYETYEEYYFYKLKNQTYDDMLNEAIEEAKL